MATAIIAGLAARGYLVQSVRTGQEAIEAVALSPPTVVVLDLGLPDIDGLEVCREVRSWSQVPIVVITADGTEDRMITAFDCGADDYITKPFSMREFLARVHVAIRHQALRDPDPAVVRVGDLIVDVAHHEVSTGDRPLSLTPKEFALLAVLARNAGRLLTHRALLSHVWGPEGVGHVEYLRVFAANLRRKLGDGPDRPRLITEPGVGYRLVERDSGPRDERDIA